MDAKAGGTYDLDTSHPSSTDDFQSPKEKNAQHNEHLANDVFQHPSEMTAEDRATALKLANEADPGPPLASWTHVQFLLTCFIVIVNSCDTGFDTTIMSSVNSMRQFQDFFGLESATPGTGVVFVSRLWLDETDLAGVNGAQGIYTVGGVCAFVPNIILPDLVGRKLSMLWGNTLLM